MFFENITLEKELVVQEKTGSMVTHDLHVHDVLEIHVLRSNEALFQLADKRYEGQPGDVFLFRPFEPHWNLVKDPDKPIGWISILFSPSLIRWIPGGYQLLTPFYAVEAVSPYIPLSSAAAQEIQELAVKALNEEREKTVGWETKQFVHVIDMLTAILRHAAAGSRSLDGSEKLDTGIIQSIEYILEHFTEEIDVTELVQRTGKQRTYFYKKFKQLTGVTPNQFIHRLRMLMAIHLLNYSDLSITHIALECGYLSVQYFNKHFSNYRGVSPREHRILHKKEACEAL